MQCHVLFWITKNPILTFRVVLFRAINIRTNPSSARLSGLCFVAAIAPTLLSPRGEHVATLAVVSFLLFNPKECAKEKPNKVEFHFFCLVCSVPSTKGRVVTFRILIVICLLREGLLSCWVRSVGSDGFLVVTFILIMCGLFLRGECRMYVCVCVCLEPLYSRVILRHDICVL